MVYQARRTARNRADARASMLRQPWLLRHLVRIPFPRDAISKRNASPLEAMDHILQTQEWRFVCFRQHTALDSGALQQTPWFSYAPVVDVSLVPVPSSEKEAPICIQVRIHNSNHAQANKWKRLDVRIVSALLS